MNVKALELIIEHEGFRSKVYNDSLGIPTIGYGRNLEAFPLSDKEIELIDSNNGEYDRGLALIWLENHIQDLSFQLSKFSWFNHLDSDKQAVLIDMAYNLGIPKLLGFKKMIEALKIHNYKEASNEMLESLWAKQVLSRAKNLAKMMEVEHV